MDAQRRQFLRHSLVVLGTAAAAGALRAATGDRTPDLTSSTAPTTSGSMDAMGAMDHMMMPTRPEHAPGASLTDARHGIPGRRWVMVIDLAKCDGCGHCKVACSKMHFVPPDRQWIKVLRMQDSEDTAPYFFPQPCFHCDNPPCTKVCPVDATFKRDDGIVLIDNTRCIGCRFCMAACPYGARSFNWGHPDDPAEAQAMEYSPEHGFPRRIGTVEKCDFCPDMAAKGMLPGCAAGCPMGAIYYGDENEDAVTNSAGETSRLSKLLRERAGYRQLEELGTKPRVYYLPPKNRAFPAPDEQKQSKGGGAV
jgi:molybdopterin-containing oxidoreductase family iron-sulfur binding subunit